MSNFGHPRRTKVFIGYGVINSETDKKDIRAWVIPEKNEMGRFECHLSQTANHLYAYGLNGTASLRPRTMEKGLGESL